MVLEINIRDAFVAPAGRLLLSADYSQIELRLLAHFSKDAGLQQLLRQAGPAGDVFTAMAARCMKDPATGAWWLGSSWAMYLGTVVTSVNDASTQRTAG
jgi:hypothetical protein